MQRKSLREKDRIIIKVKGPLSLATGEEVEIDGYKEIPLYKIWDIMMKRYSGKAKEEGVYPALEGLFSQNLILINDVEISAIGDSRAKVKPNDEIVIINFTHGG